MSEAATETHRVCPICEAACGLRVSIADSRVLGIRANDEDVFSTGHICAKGIALEELHSDPDRLRTPFVRRQGKLVEASWEEAYDTIAERLSSLIDARGRDAIATYVGNPTAHNVGLAMGLGIFGAALGSKNFYTAASVDQMPKQLACELMFGNDMAIPVPDVLNCDYLLMLGANPLVSNGSLWVVPKIRDKLRAMKQRGGQLVTVDPRRSETARLADHHHFIKPGTDAWFLVGVINCLRESGLRLPHTFNVRNPAALYTALEGIVPAEASARCGIAMADIQEVAEQLTSASAPVVYGRVGTTLQAFGTLTSFLIEVINLMTGSLDRKGGAMFPEQPFHTPKSPRTGLAYNRWQSRVSHAPEVGGQFPVSVLAEEIDTPGDGQIRGMICFAGNPLLSNPDSDRLAAAIDSLEFLVCVDIYHNETSAMADVILPGSSAFEDNHYDHYLGAMGFRNVARHSRPVLNPTQPREWDIGLTLGYIAQTGSTPSERELEEFENNVVAAHVSSQVEDPTSGIYQRDVQEIIAGVEPERGVERVLDVGIRAGRWGDHFGERDGLTLQKIDDSPNGIDLGPLREGRLTEVNHNPDGVIDLAPELILNEIDRLQASKLNDGLTLIGRRTPRTNNTWLRNLTRLTRGTNLSALYIHPADAAAHHLADAEEVVITGPGGAVTASLAITEEVARGVVCLPHGFDDTGKPQQRNLLKGPNYNRLADTAQQDEPTGTAALNGIAVTLQKKLPAKAIH